MEFSFVHDFVFTLNIVDCITFLEIDHEISSTVFHPLQLIQEGQLSVTGERMCTSTG